MRYWRLNFSPWPWTVLAALCLSGAAVSEEPRRAPVQVVVAAEAPIREVLELAGSVTAARAAALSTATAGLVAEIRVDVGDRVQAGEVLLRLDDELASYQLQSDEAAERRARQALADARRRLAEAQELATRQTIAETTVRDLQSEVIEDEADLQRAAALAGRRRGVLKRHTLRAPFDGVIGARRTDIGEWVATGASLFELVSLSEVFADFQVSEAYLGSLASGMPITLRFADAAGAPLPATVAATVPVTDPTARTFLLRARPERIPPSMRPGVSTTATLALDAGRRAVNLPRDAVLRYPDGRSVVWVVETVDGMEVAVERVVQTGLAFEGSVEIRSGILAGARVVVAGNEALRNRQPVAVVGGG